MTIYKSSVVVCPMHVFGLSTFFYASAERIRFICKLLLVSVFVNSMYCICSFVRFDHSLLRKCIQSKNLSQHFYSILFTNPFSATKSIANFAAPNIAKLSMPLKAIC